MAALLEKTRNYQKHPTMSDDERDEQFGTPVPVTRRASLPPRQRAAASDRPAPKAAATDDAQVYDTTAGAPDTERLQNEPQESIPSVLTRTRRGRALQAYEPPARRYPWKALILGTSIPVLIYSAIFVLFAGWILLTNTLTYGPVHTNYTQATINGQPSVIQTSNVEGTIYITILQQQRNGSIAAKTYIGPALDPSAWNGDLHSIVATVEVAKGQQNPTITIHLTGTIGYFHLLFARPTLTFSLIPDKQSGYKIVQS